MLRPIIGLALCAALATPASAQTADECIAEFESRRAEFDAVSPDTPYNCVQDGPIISLDVEGPLPAGCEGGWDHWHLQAKTGDQRDGFCSVRLLGLEGEELREGCGTEEFRLELPPNEAAAWRNYLRQECGL